MSTIIESAWKRLKAWSRKIDHRDVSDEANRWASEEAADRPDLLPKNIGEWKASMSIAFAAGQKYERIEMGE